MKQKVSYFAVGLFMGLVVGFLVTNYLNRPEFEPGKATATAAPGMPPASNTPGADPHAGMGETPPPTEEEIQEAMRHVDQQADSYDAQLTFARVLMQLRRPKDAVTYFKRAHDLKPDEVEPIVGLGNSTFDAAASSSDPNDPHAQYDSAALAKAAEYYQQALAKNPKDVNVRTDMGLTYLYRTPPDVDRAIAEFRRSLEVDPTHAITLMDLTHALVQKGDLSAAEETLARLQKAAPDNPAVARLQADIDEAKKGGKGDNIPTH